MKRSNRYILVLMLVVAAVIMAVTHWLALHWAYSSVQSTAQGQLQELTLALRHSLARYENLPKVVSTSDKLKILLQQPDTPQLLDEVNQHLTQVNQISDTSALYLIDRQGLVLAASNWDQKISFVGQNFAFRPYFQQAMLGEHGYYYAVGTTSNRRGYYVSSPMMEAGKVIGVVVAKVDIETIERELALAANAASYHFVVSGDSDIVFMASEPGWVLKQLTDNPKAKPITSGIRYANRKLSPLTQLTYTPFAFPNTANSKLLRVPVQDQQQAVLTNSTVMPQPGWKVSLWQPIRGLKQHAWSLTFISLVVYISLILLWAFIRERMNNVRRLQAAHQQLEDRVRLRTADLTEVNRKLMTQVEENRITQERLKETQDELIQAAKLAVIGSMSASINHEINQPLAALRSYSQNAQAFLQRGKTEKTERNLEIIIELVDRLADIVGQFKSFTRKSEGSNVPINIQNSMNNAAGIVIHQAVQQGVTIKLRQPEQQLFVLGDPVQLEQVIVNLLSNAIQALTSSEDKRIWLIGKLDEDKVTITIQDSGPGISRSDMDQIFEPFFTTKSAHGLGLGLSISKRIIESMGGEMTVTNCDEPQGAVFTITLRRQ